MTAALSITSLPRSGSASIILDASTSPSSESGGAVRQNRPGLSPSRTSMSVSDGLVADGDMSKVLWLCSGFSSSLKAASASEEVPGPMMTGVP
jgi:hypothetical protein